MNLHINRNFAKRPALKPFDWETYRRIDKPMAKFFFLEGEKGQKS